MAKKKGELVMAILQWREYGADEDSLSVALMEVPGGIWPGQVLAEREALANQLRYDPDADDQGEQHGDLMVINDLHFAHGEVMTTEDGRKFKLNFTEVK